MCRAIMSDIDRDSRVLSLGNRTGLRQNLTTLLDQLGRCQKALNEFLEVKYCRNAVYMCDIAVTLRPSLPTGEEVSVSEVLFPWRR